MKLSRQFNSKFHFFLKAFSGLFIRKACKPASHIVDLNSKENILETGYKYPMV